MLSLLHSSNKKCSHAVLKPCRARCSAIIESLTPSLLLPNVHFTSRSILTSSNQSFLSIRRTTIATANIPSCTSITLDPRRRSKSLSSTRHDAALLQQLPSRTISSLLVPGPASLSPSLHHHHPHYGHRRRYLSSVFVSRHNNSLNVSASTILEYCQSHGIPDVSKAKHTHSHVVLRECPFCTKPTNDKASNLYKLHIQIGGGAYFCHRCGTGGSWYDFKARLGGYVVERTFPNSTTNNNNHYNYNVSGTAVGFSNNPGSLQRNPSYVNTNDRLGGGMVGGSFGRGRMGIGFDSTFQHQQDDDATIAGGGGGNTIECLPLPHARMSGFYSSQLLDPPNEDNDVLKYLQDTRGLTSKTLRKYGVGRATYKFPSDRGGYQDAECVTFPWIMRASDVQSQETLRGATFTVPNQKEQKQSDDYRTTEADPKVTVDTTVSDEGTKKLLPEETSSTPSGVFVTRRIKVRALEQKAWQRLDPPGGGWGLFGLHTVPDDAVEIILTEGEYDAMAVSQATGRPAVSLPNGCRSLPVQVLPLLERFEKIYLWMDSDAPGQEGTEKFAKKLGLNRSYIVQCLDAKDANDALLKGLDLESYLAKAALVPHDRILTFRDLRSEVLHELLQPDLYTGVPITSLPNFTKLVKGFRRGEMTVLTGPTGSGKTTFLGQVTMDLAEQGINVLWGSFEIKNTRLMHKLLKQFSRDVLPSNSDPNANELFNALADRFEELPLYFMRFHGGSEVDEVLDAMEYAVYVNDVEHIVLDNMQFMISRNTQKNSFDKFDVQDVAIEKFRKFATEHNVHLTLVVHPRKEDESSKLSISSIYGSAKATQEADTVIILQHDGRRKFIDVKKNRFDGTLGYIPIYYESKSGRYVEDERMGDRTGNQNSNVSFQPPRPEKALRTNNEKQQKAQPEALVDPFEMYMTATNKRA